MNTRRLATALDNERVSESRAQAPGLVSRMMVRSAGLCSDHGLVLPEGCQIWETWSGDEGGGSHLWRPSHNARNRQQHSSRRLRAPMDGAEAVMRRIDAGGASGPLLGSAVSVAR